MKKIFLFLAVMALAVTLLPGCAELEGTSQTSGTGFGGIEVRVTDAPPGYEILKVVVNFSEVSVHKAGNGSEDDGGWIDLNIVTHSFDLKEFDGGNADNLTGLLAESDIPTGMYTQIRVVIAEGEDVNQGVWVTYQEKDNEEAMPTTVQAKLPSGVLKFVRTFYVVDGITTILTLDFDLARSVNFTGATQSAEPKIIVKPVVKISVEQAEIDLALTADNITFDDPNPTTGDNVTITAAIENAGDIDLENVVVRFYDGDPESGGIQIDGDQTIASIPAGGSDNASVEWKEVTVGVYNIYVVVDPDNAIPESDETNNVAYKPIEVTAPPPPP